MSTPSLATSGPTLRLASVGPATFQTAAADHLCVGRKEQPFLFGGSAFAAAIDAFERVTDRPVIQASAQFVTAARPGEIISLAPVVLAAGRSVNQCAVSATIGDRLLLMAQGTTGSRNDPNVHQRTTPPDVPPPHLCAPRSVARLLSSKVNDLFEFRLATGEWPDRADWIGAGGLDTVCWVRLRAGAEITRSVLAVIADCVALAIPSALGRPASGTSLDNSIRFIGPAARDQVLLSMRVDAIRGGIAHISSEISNEDGQVVALAAQSMVLRIAPPVTPP